MSFQQIKLMVVLVLATLLPTPAFAETGVVAGTVLFVNGNGNYCPSSQNCKGSWYPQSSFNTRMPVSNAKIFVIDPAKPPNMNVIGEGRTDDTGAWLAGWDTKMDPAPAKIAIMVTALQADGIFGLFDPAGQYANGVTDPFTPTAGTTLFTPQVLVDPGVIGTEALPDNYFNAYWAAEWEWRTVIHGVGSAQANFNNIEIRGFQNIIPGFLTPGGNHPSSAAVGSMKRVQLDANAAMAPQARVMHELGHVANYIAHPARIATVYDWAQGATPPVKIIPNPGPWAQDSAEWGAVAFEEAFATHYGSIAFWALDSEVPTTCLAGQGISCYLPSAGVKDSLVNPATTLEASSFPVGGTDNCSTAAANPESRWPLTAMRYFWDIFDDHDGEGGDTYSAGKTTFWQHLAVLHDYPEGTGPNQIDEPWDDKAPDVTEPDGRACASYEANYQAKTGDATATQRAMNCTPF